MAEFECVDSSSHKTWGQIVVLDAIDIFTTLQPALSH